MDRLLDQKFRLLPRQPRYEVVERRKADIDEGRVLRRRGGAEAFEQVRDADVGDIVLFDARLDRRDVLDLVVEALVAAEDIDKVRDLVFGEFAVRHGQASL